MKNSFLRLILLMFTTGLFSQTQNVVVEKGNDGMTLLVDGEPFMINGMNWDYVPIGTNYSYDFWSNSDDFIKSALDAEMGLLK